MSTKFKFFKFICPSYSKKGVVVIRLASLGSLLDFFSLASFVLLIFLLVNPDFISSNEYINNLYNTLGFSSPSAFNIALTLCVLIFTLIKNMIGLWITRWKATYTFSVRSDLSSRGLRFQTPGIFSFLFIVNLKESDTNAHQ